MPLDVSFVESSSLSRDEGPRCRQCHWLTSSPVHRNVCHRFDEPVPEWEELDSAAAVKRWLGHPKNWFDSRLKVLKWTGQVPTISAWHVDVLFSDPTLAKVVLMGPNYSPYEEIRLIEEKIEMLRDEVELEEDGA